MSDSRKFRIRNESNQTVKVEINEQLLFEKDYEDWMKFKGSEEYRADDSAIGKPIMDIVKLQTWYAQRYEENGYAYGKWFIPPHKNMLSGEVKYGFVFEPGQEHIVDERQMEGFKYLERKEIVQKLKPYQSKPVIMYEGIFSIAETTDEILEELRCEVCKYVAKNKLGLLSHMKKHEGNTKV